jgi:hypothetical protein
MISDRQNVASEERDDHLSVVLRSAGTCGVDRSGNQYAVVEYRHLVRLVGRDRKINLVDTSVRDGDPGRPGSVDDAGCHDAVGVEGDVGFGIHDLGREVIDVCVLRKTVGSRRALWPSRPLRPSRTEWPCRPLRPSGTRRARYARRARRTRRTRDSLRPGGSWRTSRAAGSLHTRGTNCPLKTVQSLRPGGSGHTSRSTWAGCADRARATLKPLRTRPNDQTCIAHGGSRRSANLPPLRRHDRDRIGGCVFFWHTREREQLRRP